MSDSKLCRLCLIETDCAIDIFGEDGNSLEIAIILAQHFWFQVCEDDGYSPNICVKCWQDTENFHEFYKKIENIQKDYHNNIVIKTPKINKSNKKIKLEPVEEQLISDKNKLEIQSIFENTPPVLGESKIETFEIITGDVIKNDKSDNSDDEFDANDCNEDWVKHEESADQNSEEDEEEDSSSDYVVKSELGRTKKSPRKRKAKKNKAEDVVGDVNNSEDGTKSPKKKPKRDTLKEDEQIREYFNMDCDMCNTKFDTFLKAKHHYSRVHKVDGYITCCGKKFLRKYRILEHIMRHVNPNEFTCLPCDKIFADKFALKNHIENHEPVDTRQHKCDLCPSTFTKASKLTSHLRINHISEEDKQFKCDQCNKNFATKTALAYHVRGVHENAFVQVCDICAKVFKSKHVFQNHRLEHSDVVRPRMQCNVCGAWLKHEESLRKHLQRHKDTFANCPICNKVLQNKHSLGNHIRSVHGERSHKCTMCDKAFKKAIVLKEHMALHTGEDLYKCAYCPKTFKSGANMHAHRKKSHHDEWSVDRLKRFTPNPTKIDETPDTIVF